MEVKGAVAIVTGASRGLGRAVAAALVEAGARVALSARGREDLERAASELQLRHGERSTVAVIADATAAADRERLLRETEAALGPVDILVNNAGIERFSPYAGYEPAELQRYLDADLAAPMLLTRLVLPGMLQRRRGHVVNMSSMAALKGVPFNVPYSAAKAGLVAFSDGLRHELLDTGVSVTAVCPGFVRGEGMFARHAHAVKLGGLLGTVSVDAVASATVDAIVHDRPRVLVAPWTMRLGGVLGAAAPGFVTRLSERSGLREMNRKRAAEDAQRTL
jgi:short-subunit dehydrogenase